jgi:23S rRNA (uridine2552-2'-O)-methyltransferase
MTDRYRRADSYTHAARARGYPARSVFKLEDLDARLGLLRPGMHVLDLGAAPGSWSLHAAGRIGPHGRLLAVDLQPLQVRLPPNSRFHQGDALALDDTELAAFAPYDVVLSDMAPATTGSKVADEARSVELVLRAAAVAGALGAPGHALVAKLFMGPDYGSVRDGLREQYRDVRTLRPKAVRANSMEVYLACRS